MPVRAKGAPRCDSRARFAAGTVALAVAAGLTACSGSDASDTNASVSNTASSTAPAETSAAENPSAAAPAARITCEEAFSVRPAGRGQPAGSDTVGAVRFTQIKDGGRPEGLLRPSAERDYFAAKTPFEVTLGPRAVIGISVQGGRILIGETTTGAGTRPWERLPQRVDIIPCPTQADTRRHVAAFPGGFAFPRPGCVDVTVRMEGQEPVTRSFPLGVPAC